ncbi:hypothetical protein O3M35_012063 [Rhynocoris fuscipes]|uniref:Cytochrome P450 n=1 Tax=Rhynocoris fuscipes TaxID=488301 RepID=A0AAW1CXI4_9HEMI
MDLPSFILSVVLIILLFLYWFLTRNYNFWESRGVPCRKQEFLFGNLKDRVFLKTSFHEFIQDFYKEMKGKPFAGMYEGTRPVLFVLDPDLIKLILVKHFDHFMDRPVIKYKSEGYLEKMMIALQGNEWKRTRVACTPAFSSGRLKSMVPLFDTCGKQMIQYLNRVIDEQGETTLDIRALLINYTLNSIASTSFGISIDSYTDKESEFVKYALALQDISIFKRIIILITILYEVPEWITSRLPLSLFNDDSIRVFTKTLIETRNARLKNNTRRNDLLQLLLDAQAAPVEVIGETDQEISNEKRELIDEATALAQSVFFFVAGFESSSTQLSMACYELAKNKDIQEKARNDILSHWPDDNELTYDVINSMTYLDMVLSETLRLYPPLSRIDRTVTKPIDLNGLKLDYNMRIAIPASGLHHDPQYYPDPMVFKPERFSQEEKSKRNPYVYLPFGAGPRNCIGLRFVSISSKICMAYLLRNYQIDVCDQTPIPFEYHRRAFFLKAKKPIILKLKKIN